MKIMGAFIRSDEVVGISEIVGVQDGIRFYYQFSVITKSTSMEFISDRVEDVHIATKHEQESLRDFRLKYEMIRQKIALHIGDADAVIAEERRKNLIEDTFHQLGKKTDELARTIQHSKWKNKNALATTVGEIWAYAMDLKKQAI